MRHPLEFVSDAYRKRIFFTLLLLTLILFGIFRVLDVPLRTPAAPNGIVSFELARTPEKAFQILASWEPIPGQGVVIQKAKLFAAFGLGIDYLFMPLYALTLAFGTLLAAGRHGAWLKFLGIVTGYGAFVAAAFDAVENYALFQILLGKVFPPYPEVAFYCAVIKFMLLICGLAVAISGWLLPKSYAR